MDTTPAEATKAIFDYGEEKRAEGRAEAAKEHARMVRALAKELPAEAEIETLDMWASLERLAQAIEKGAK